MVCVARIQDLKGNRGFPEDPRLAANQKLQAEVTLRLSYLHQPMNSKLLL